VYVLKNHKHNQFGTKDRMQLIDRTLGPDVPDLQERGFARKWTEMDRNKYIIGTEVWSVIEQRTNYVK